MNIPSILLNNGKSMPMVGLGTWRTPADVVEQVITDAIEVGYKHIDCAPIYGNQLEIGNALQQILNGKAIKREELFITSKLWNTHHHPSMVLHACQKTLADLRLSYLDLYLMHWPTAFKDGDDLRPLDEHGKTIFSDVDFVATWLAMEKLLQLGLCHSIGLSNFNRAQIERILTECHIRPANLQIECHPYLNQKRLIKYCTEQNIAVTAYSPLGSAHSPYDKPGVYALIANPTIANIARTCNKSTAQILLRYQLQRNVCVIPRSINKLHMLQNLQIFDFSLSAENVQQIDDLDINGRFLTWTLAAGHPHHPFENDEY